MKHAETVGCDEFAKQTKSHHNAATTEVRVPSESDNLVNGLGAFHADQLLVETTVKVR